jgi:hypothetical protein
VGHTHTHGSGSATRFVVNVAVHECNISHSGNSGVKDLILSLQDDLDHAEAMVEEHTLGSSGRSASLSLHQSCVSVLTLLLLQAIYTLSILLLLQPREVSSLLVGCHPWCTNAAFLCASTPDNSSRFVVLLVIAPRHGSGLTRTAAAMFDLKSRQGLRLVKWRRRVQVLRLI